MAEFKIAYEATMAVEGFYSLDPRDRGGETWKGIARNMNPDWEGWLIVDMIKRSVDRNELNRVMRADEELESLVQDFYQENFWKKCALYSIKEQEVANEIFDTAVNQGPAKAGKYFQGALNLLNSNQSHYSDIVIDGRIGPDTMKAYAAYMLTANFPGRSVIRNIRTLLKVLNGLQFEWYSEICALNPGQEVYFYGWVNRV